MKRKALSILLAAALSCSIMAGTKTAPQAAGKTAEKAVAESPAQHFVEMTAEELTADMGAGWNLGNTMDGHTGFTPNEIQWQNVKTTKKLIRSVHDLGFNTVRIPVTWGTMIDDTDGYAINEAWISRVQDIVDYCTSQDMYAIINIHHDGADQMSWLNIGTGDKKALEDKFAGVWKNISERFRNYDEHLIFESMNEVQAGGMTVFEQNQVIMGLNQIFVNTVRATGGNNAKRWLMVPGKFNYIDSICNEKNGFKIPEDTVKRIILSVHDYTPWNFCGSESAASESNTVYSIERLEANDRELLPLYEMYTSKGIPVVVGEYGCINKDNVTERAFYLEGMNRIFRKYKLVGVYWDQGWYDRSMKPDYSFSIIDRETGKPIEKEVTDAIMRGYFGTKEDYTTLEKNPVVVPMKDLKVSETSLEMKVKESKTLEASFAPDDTKLSEEEKKEAKCNDVLLWKTDHPEVATVAYGKIQANGIGTAKITAFSQSGSASCEVTVTVMAEQAAVPCTDLQLPTEEYSLLEGEAVYLSPVMAPSNTTEGLYFKSMDESVVTVSPIGKLVATGKGETTVKVCTTGGKEKEVKVAVAAAAVEKLFRLSLNVYYNDSTHNYFSNEISNNVISVNKNGQYTLSFDCNSDLSDAAKAAGVSDLNRVTAIYIKDYDVATGKASKTPLSVCQIRYDKITADGAELTLKNNDYKSALKDSGIFDTNDPINAWDGSAIEEISMSNHAINFTTAEPPKKIEVTFTLDHMCFEGSGPEPVLPPENQEPEETLPPSDTVKKGDSVTKGKGIYKVTSVKSNTVQYVKPSEKGLKNVEISSAVKIGGKSYKVTAIAENALKNNKTVQKAAIGKNVKTIGKMAFYGCKNLTKITVKTSNLTLKNVGKQAFAKGNKKITITVPKKKQKAYQTLFKKRGMEAGGKVVGK